MHANAIEDQAGAARTGDLQDPLGGFGGISVVDDIVGAKRLGMLELRVVNISGDDADGGEHTQELNRHVPKPTDAEHHNRAVRREVRQRSLDRVIRRQRGIAERRGLRRTQAAERDEQPRGRHEHEFGHPAVETQATAEAIQLGPVLTVVLHRLLTRVAKAAAPRTVDGDGIAVFDTRDAVAALRHPARVLMTERERRLEAEVLLHHVQIRVAHAGATDLDQDLPWAWRWLLDVLYLRRATDADKSNGLHGFLPSSFNYCFATARIATMRGHCRSTCDLRDTFVPIEG